MLVGGGRRRIVRNMMQVVLPERSDGAGVRRLITSGSATPVPVPAPRLFRRSVSARLRCDFFAERSAPPAPPNPSLSPTSAVARSNGFSIADIRNLLSNQ